MPRSRCTSGGLCCPQSPLPFAGSRACSTVRWNRISFCGAPCIAASSCSQAQSVVLVGRNMPKPALHELLADARWQATHVCCLRPSAMHRDPHRYFRLGMLCDSNLLRMRGGSGATQPAQVCGPARLGKCCPISDATHFPVGCFSAAMYLSWCLLLPETFVRRAFETNISVTGSPPSQPRRVPRAPQVMQLATRRCLRMPPPPPPTACHGRCGPTPGCGVQVNRLGDHELACPRTGLARSMRLR